MPQSPEPTRDRSTLIAVALIAVLLGLFASLASGAGSAGLLSGWDDRLIQLVRGPELESPVGPSWMLGVLQQFSALGSGPVVALLTLVILGYLLVIRHPRTALVFVVCILGAAFTTYWLKGVWQRPRPLAMEAAFALDSFSFPSGHSLIAAAVYPTLGGLLTRVIASRRARIYCMVVALGLTWLIGFSRVYLGRHYPTDVLAGWCLGLAWSVAAWLVLRRLQREGVVAGPGEDELQES
ncbi:MAG: phosphatase PAP2 family protein [Myxococcales bacterium]|nr:phosphatase PAP2 family protein [Myxococcales bacterium]